MIIVRYACFSSFKNPKLHACLHYVFPSIMPVAELIESARMGGGWKINVVFDYTELCVVRVFIILSIMFDHMMPRYLIIKIDAQVVHNYLYINTGIWMTLCAYDFRDLREFCLMLYLFLFASCFLTFFVVEIWKYSYYMYFQLKFVTFMGYSSNVYGDVPL